MNNKQYIGDSVYVEIERGMVKLTTNNGYPDDPRNTIYLELQVYDELVRYVERAKAIHEGAHRNGKERTVKSELTELEKLVVEIEKAGRDWIDAKLRSDQLEDGEKNFLAALMNGLDDKTEGKISESKLDRLARGTPEYGQYVVGMVAARAETGRRKIRYESLMNLLEAKRSQMAFERAKIEKGIFDVGR